MIFFRLDYKSVMKLSLGSSPSKRWIRPPGDGYWKALIEFLFFLKYLWWIFFFFWNSNKLNMLKDDYVLKKIKSEKHSFESIEGKYIEQ